MSRAGWIRHALVFVASIVVLWLSGVVPILMLKPKIYAGLSNEQILLAMGSVDPVGLLRAIPIYIALAIAQALTFHYVKKWPTPIYLAGIFILGSLLAWRYWTAMA